MRRVATVVAAVSIAALSLTGCKNSLICPTPQKQADGSFYVPQMSKSCEKKLVTYDHHKHPSSTPSHASILKKKKKTS